MKDLTEEVLKFQETRTGLETLMEEIGMYVYRYPMQRLGWEHDDACDFYCSFCSRIPRLVARFKYGGKPFEAYLAAALKWHVKTFTSSRAMERADLRILTRDEFWYHDEHASRSLDAGIDGPMFSGGDGSLPVADGLPDYAPAVGRLFKLSEDGTMKDRVSRRRLLLIALREFENLDHRLIEKILRSGGFDEEWFYGRIHELKDRLDGRRERREVLRRRRNRIFFAIYRLHERYELECDREHRGEIMDEITELRRKLGYTVEEIARLYSGPSHRDLAEVLGIPKGSVDSGFYTIRNVMAGRAAN